MCFSQNEEKGVGKKKLYARQKVYAEIGRVDNALNRIVHLHNAHAMYMSLVCRRGRSVYSTIVIFVSTRAYTLCNDARRLRIKRKSILEPCRRYISGGRNINKV